MKHFHLCFACILFGAPACAEGTQSLGEASSEGSSGGNGGAQSGVSSAASGQGGAAQGSSGQGAAGQGGAGQGGTGQGAAGQGGAGQGGSGQGSTAQASSGQGGGGDPCVPAQGDTECDVCRKQSCCAELAACAASTLCTCWVECIDMHPMEPNNTVTCSSLCGAPAPALTQINGVFQCQQACGVCPPVPWA
jgi:hypothetical protein